MCVCVCVCLFVCVCVHVRAFGTSLLGANAKLFDLLIMCLA